MYVAAMLEGTPETDTDTTLTALGLAKRLNVPVRGICALPDPGAAMMVVATPEAGGFPAETTRSIIEMQDAVLKAARGAFDSVMHTGAHGLDATFVHEVATCEQAGANAATLAEALVFPRNAAKSPAPLFSGFEHVLMHARLPVVLGGTHGLEHGPIIVAWDGSNTAARSVRFHLPLIKAFGEVIVAQNKSDAQREGARPVSKPAALENWLADHGLKVTSTTLDGEVAAGLLAAAKGAEASLIVAGAYGHSRLGERLFGGTTQRLLDARDAPALALAH